uniref:HYDIN/VesB/CFA65-like Ig-like domain-containing protein n=1 Tax=Neogobius melanostomus TaxID=47308 RepID=A0A8C6T3I3_9GOBI
MESINLYFGQSQSSWKYSSYLKVDCILCFQRTPSTFARELLRSSEERLANIKQMEPPRILELLDMANTTFHKLSSVDMDQALFQPYPTEILFQNFTAGETYKLPLWLFNMDKVPRHVRLEQVESQFFHVAGPEGASSKVAPGLSAAFTVVFTPQDNKDYQHALVFVTERERFEVPVTAIGPRAILDFRDELLLPTCPVKASTERTHLIRNIGNSRAHFRLHTEIPFSVEPASGSLEVGESLQVTVTFAPLSAGEHTQDLLLSYHTGEVVYIRLSGACEELAIRLEPDAVHLKKTYIKKLLIIIIMHYLYMLFQTLKVSLQFWALRIGPRTNGANNGRKYWGENHLFELKQPSHFLSFLSLRPVRVADVVFASLFLQEGEIWPKVTQEFHINFKPQAHTLYQQTLYCHITGRESPLSLTVKGEGMGPRLVPSYSVMDMRKVFIGDNDWYEVTLTNKGLIDAPFQMSSPDTTFGRCFSFSPAEGVVLPAACQVVTVSFSSPVLGPFSEDLLLTVKGQPHPLNLNFRGCVIGPTFDFDVKELNFGDVAFGFPQTALVTLFNKSFVPMTFSLCVLGDGSGPPSVTCVQQVKDMSRQQWQCGTAEDRRVRPKEFTVSPQADTVSAMSQATLCSNTVRRYKLALAVDVEGVGKEIKTLPINARWVYSHRH